MYNKSDDQLLIIQATIESNRQDYNEKMKNLTEDLTAIITSMMEQIKISESSPDKKDPPRSQGPTTVFPANNIYQPLEGGNSTKIGGKWNLNNEIISPKLYELLIKK